MKNSVHDGGRLLVGLGVAALATAGSLGLSRGAYEVLMAQARVARRLIPKPTTWPFNGDGIYLPGADVPEPARLDATAEIEMMVFGDSLAAGLGASSRAELPGVLLAQGVAEESGKSVRLSTKAIVGASSKSLFSQVEAMQITGGAPDIAVILVGGNDVTAKNGIFSSAKRLGQAVHELVESGAQVVVGTCPDLGVVQPVPQPLRTVMHSWSLRLADAQAAQVRAAGGIPVSLADTLTQELMSRPEALFSPDQFHPNSDGYALAAAILLPAVCSALGIWPDDAPLDRAAHGDGKDDVTTTIDERAEVTGAPDMTDSAGDDGEGDDGEGVAAAGAGHEPTNDGHVVKQLLGRLRDFVGAGEADAHSADAPQRDWHDSPFADAQWADTAAGPAEADETAGQTAARHAAGRFFARSRFRSDDGSHPGVTPER